MSGPGRILVLASRLTHLVARCLESVGAGPEEARAVADVLVEADLRGIDSHGVARLGRYVEGVRQGKISVGHPPEILQETAATALVDAHNGLGQPAGIFAMELAVHKAMESGVGLVCVRRTNHFGIAGYYPLLAVRHGMLGWATTNASPQVAPTFSATAMYGTNPIAVALPTGGEHPFVLDMATSVVPRGKLERLRREGGSIPEGWAVDDEGQPVTRLGELVDGLIGRRGFALLPLGGAGEEFGGHKGFGLGLLVDLLCGPLAGSSWGRHVYGPKGADLGQWFGAVRIDCFCDPEKFWHDSALLLDEIRRAPRATGRKRIYVAGEKEAEERERRSKDGLMLHANVYEQLAVLAQEAGVPLDLR